mgnify:CR=1 FL=1
MEEIKEDATKFNVELDLQGEKIDNVNEDLKEADTNVAKGNEEITKANTLHKSSGKCLLWVALGILLMIGVLIAILFGTSVF